MAAKKLQTPPQRIEFLLRRRRRIAETNWNAVGPYGGGPHEQVLVEHDAELMAAIAAWQQRRLAEVDGQLRELGIGDIAALEAEFARLAEEHRVRQMAAMEAAVPGKPFMLILPERET
jgi:hypothetical protein